MDEIEHQKIVGVERGRAFLADLLQEAQELRILDLAVKGEPYEVGVRAGEIRQRLALPDALPKDEVKALAGALDEAAFSKDLGNAPIARALLPQNVVRRRNENRRPPT